MSGRGRHQPRALGVGVVEGLDAVGRVIHGFRVHVRHVLHADTLGERGVLGRWGDPLVRRSVGDPRGDAAVEVEGGPVDRVAGAIGDHRGLGGGVVAHGDLRVHRLGVRLHELIADRRHAGSHDGGVNGQEQVSTGARGQQVAELDPDGLALLGHDGRAEVARISHRGAVGVQLHVASQLRLIGEVLVHLRRVLDEPDPVEVRSGIAGGVRCGNEVSEVGQRVDELAETAGDLVRSDDVGAEGVGASLPQVGVVGRAEGDGGVLQRLCRGVRHGVPAGPDVERDALAVEGHEVARPDGQVGHREGDALARPCGRERRHVEGAGVENHGVLVRGAGGAQQVRVEGEAGRGLEASARRRLVPGLERREHAGGERGVVEHDEDAGRVVGGIGPVHQRVAHVACGSGRRGDLGQRAVGVVRVAEVPRRFAGSCDGGRHVHHERVEGLFGESVGWGDTPTGTSSI
ncbi:hypothetical protein EDD32_2469 [Georgenia muralis]|uniref:Uncharacterized protein n=1 Tax=Georgenia muralis TaxID=154117 RepID=A0A3N5A3P0_9MICO|nr:hypothetical protein EDD32_2469 [Georgenia muralis]